MDKKGSGTASSFLIASLIGISILVAIGVMVNDFSTSYDKSSISYFNNYDAVNNETKGIAEVYIGEIDYDVNGSNPAADRTEDYLFLKAFNSVRKIPKLINGVRLGITQVGSDIGLSPMFTNLLIAGLIILLITLVIKVFRGFSDV